MSIPRSLTAKSFALSALLSLTAIPLSSHAAGIDRAVDACVSAFVDRYLPDRSVMIRKLLPAPGPLDVLSRRDNYTIAIDARSRHGGELLAQASCVASRRGDVIVLEDSTSPELVAKADLRATLLR